MATNVQVLEQTQLIRTETAKASNGQQKICAAKYHEIVIRFSDNSRRTEDDVIEVAMPLGLYTSCSVTAPCGLCSRDGVIGLLDVPAYFLDPSRMRAGLIWFERGHVEYKFPNNDEGRKQIMDYLHKRIADIRKRLPRAFATLVPGNMEIKRMAPEVEPGAPGAYGGAGSIDGKIPGRFWINLRTTDLHSKYSLADLTFHEAIPGHIWQGEYTHAMPLIRQILAFNAYSEGWALYAEQLADELGAYEDDHVGRLGYLQSIAFRACRLVVDTGIHAKGWTRAQAVRLFVDVNGSNPEAVASEVDRYCSWPGQACGYKVGHSEINRQRDKAKAALGVTYDLKAFDDVVVLGGNVPLDVLGKNVDEYIRTASG